VPQPGCPVILQLTGAISIVLFYYFSLKGLLVVVFEGMSGRTQEDQQLYSNSGEAAESRRSVRRCDGRVAAESTVKRGDAARRAEREIERKVLDERSAR
jgi:hypothetical protein